MRLPYGVLPFQVVPKTTFIPLLFLFCIGLEGASTLHTAVADHYFLGPETWWVPLVLLVVYNAALMVYLHPILHLATHSELPAPLIARLARTSQKRFRHLAWFSVGLSVSLLFAADFLTALLLGHWSAAGPVTALKILVNLAAGFFLGVLVHFLVENNLFAAKRMIRQLAPDLPLPYQGLYFKIFLVLVAITAHLVVQTVAVLPAFIMVDRPAEVTDGGSVVQGKGSLMSMKKNSEVLFNAARYGAKDVLEVYLVQMFLYLSFIVLMLLQIKALIRTPLKTIGGRLRDLNQGRPEDLCTIDVVQNDEFAAVFTEINRLIDTQKTALTASQQRLSHIVAGAADPIVVFDGTGAIRLFNPSAVAFFGYPADEAMALSFGSLVELPEAVACACEGSALPLIEYLRDETSSLSRHQGIRKDGTRRPFESNISTTETPEGPLFTAVLRDISAQLAVEEALTRAKVEAENANRMKSEFLANMSHELRTPLNAVLGFTQLLSNDKNLTGGQLEKIAIISRSGEHLLALINDILDISKIEAGKFEVHQGSFDLEAFVGDLRDMFLLKCKAKGLHLDVETLEGLPRYVKGDLGKLRQVMINLVGNAVKFTNEGGIGIVVGADGDRIRFSVNDSGKGIPQDELELILQPFTQSSNTDHEGGTGLGLAISHRFIDLMGGRLEISSQVGVGSTFSFAVRLEVTDEAPGTAEPVLKAVAVKEGRAVLALIVDDKQTNRLILKEMLEGVGFTTVEASNGREAVDRAREYGPRIVFMDIKMPVLDGYAAVAELKSDPGLAKIPVFALTASAFKHDEDHIAAAGFDGFLAKPFKQSSLFRLIHDKTDVEMEYETGAAVPPEGVRTEVEPLKTVAARLGAEGLTALDDMALINDFTGIRHYAEAWKADLPGLASTLVRLAGAFDEGALADLVAGIRAAQEKA